jgi:hypothetical protein
MRRTLASIVVSVLCVLFLTQTALGHTEDFYDGEEWADLSVEYYRASDGSSWNNTWINNLNDADGTWGDISSTDGFLFAQQGVERDQTTCINIANEDSTVKRYDFGDGPGGVLGMTDVCHLGSSDEKFEMQLDTATNWYHTAGNDGVNGTTSALGVLTHEFGHATGFGISFSGPAHFSSPCDWVNDPQNVQTMCANAGGDLDRLWRWTSLETHDLHEFNSAY